MTIRIFSIPNPNPSALNWFGHPTLHHSKFRGLRISTLWFAFGFWLVFFMLVVVVSVFIFWMLLLFVLKTIWWILDSNSHDGRLRFTWCNCPLSLMVFSPVFFSFLVGRTSVFLFYGACFCPLVSCFTLRMNLTF